MMDDLFEIFSLVKSKLSVEYYKYWKFVKSLDHIPETDVQCNFYIDSHNGEEIKFAGKKELETDSKISAIFKHQNREFYSRLKNNSYYLIISKEPIKKYHIRYDDQKVTEITNNTIINNSVFIKDYCGTIMGFYHQYDVLFVEEINVKNNLKSTCPNLFIKYADYPEVIDSLQAYLNNWQNYTQMTNFKLLPDWAQEHIKNSNLF